MTPLNRAASLAVHVIDRVRERLWPYSARAFFDARQKELGEVEPLDLTAVILAMAGVVPEFTFVSIGAFDGNSNDPVADVVRRPGIRGVFVEPQPAPFAALSRAFADCPQIAVERAAVTARDGPLPFYSVDPEFWRRHGFPEAVRAQISSLNREQIRKHVEFFGSRSLAEREDEYLVLDEVPGLSLATLLDRHRMTPPHLVQVDTEGFDFEILQMIDWSRPPPLVHFETLHLSVADRQAAWMMLRDRGYRLYATDLFNTLAVWTHGPAD